MTEKKERPTLALVVPSLGGGGGVPSVARFLKRIALKNGGWNLKLVSLCMASNDPESVSLRQPQTWLRGVTSRTGEWDEHPYVHVGAIAGELEFQRYRRRRVLDELLSDSDVIQVVCGSPAWANAVVGLGKPIALQVATRSRVERRQRDRRPRSLAAWWRKAMTEITDKLDESALRSVDGIQVENPWMLDYARKVNVGRDVLIRYAPPGVDASCFRPTAVRDLRTAPYILCVGRLDDRRKNVGLLLEAYSLLPAELKATVRLVLAGAAGPPASFWQRAESLGLSERVSFVHGPDEEALVRLYQGSTVFALPSDEEGLGVVILEAMACAIPVVSTRSGGPDGVISDGVDGYLVGLDDAAALTARLTRLLTDSEHNLRIGEAARATILQRYEEGVAGRAFLEMYEELLSRGRAGKLACAA